MADFVQTMKDWRMIDVIPGTLGDKTLGEATVDRLMSINTQTDIAEKLGMKPKE